MLPTRKRRIAKMLAMLPIFVLVVAGLIWVVEALWNSLMPAIFAAHTVTYRQAFGLMVLSWILFRGFRGPSFSRMDWERGMRKRWQRMTPAEREEFMKGLRTKWGGAESPEAEPRV